MIVDSIYLNMAGQPEHLSLDMHSTMQFAHGITRPEIFTVNDNEVGFLKNSTDFDDTDTLELVVNYIGRLLRVRFAREYYISPLQNDCISGLLSIRDSLSGYTYYGMDRALSFAWRNSRAKELLDIAECWQTICHRYKREPDGLGIYSNTIICTDINDCLLTINLPISALNTGASNKHHFVSSYVKMLLFDIAIGNIDRTLENYGILLSDSFNDLILAGLFDCATLRKPLYPPDCYSLNGITFERELIAQALKFQFSEIASLHQQMMVRILKDNLQNIKNACLSLHVEPVLTALLVDRLSRFIIDGFGD